MALTVLLDILHVAIIEHGEIGPGFSVGTEKISREEPGYRGARFY